MCNLPIILNKLIYYLAQAFCFLSLTFISLELIIGLRNPISNAAKRLKIYKLILFICTAGMIVYVFSRKFDQDGNETQLDVKIYKSKNLSTINYLFF